MPDRATSSVRQCAATGCLLQMLTHFGRSPNAVPDGSIRGFERHVGVVREETNRDFTRAMVRIGYGG